MSYLIIGLGNPGKKYEDTRHNIGFKVADKFSERLNIKFFEKHNFYIAEGEISDSPVFIMKPMTFMNRSGQAVRNFLKYKNIDGRNIFIIHDDLDLPLGAMRLRWNGSSGGHNGIKSIISETGTADFYRLKIGIDKPPVREMVEYYVLEPFSKAEMVIVNETIERSVECIISAISEGPQKAMNKYNRT